MAIDLDLKDLSHGNPLETIHASQIQSSRVAEQWNNRKLESAVELRIPKSGWMSKELVS